MELKSCPFCGGEAYMARTYSSYIVVAKHDDNCPLFVRPIPYDTHWATREAACAAWNRRADDNHPGQIKILDPNADTKFKLYDALPENIGGGTTEWTAEQTMQWFIGTNRFQILPRKLQQQIILRGGARWFNHWVEYS